MIYITGDCHKDFTRFTHDEFPEQENMTRDDYMIICGDFGGVWYGSGDSQCNVDVFDLNWLEERPYTTLFVDGNHENFDELYKCPVREWHGGKVHEIRPHVLHLMRGKVFEICGKKILAFGGAKSHDIQDGVIEWDEKGLWKYTASEWNRAGKIFRINHYSWWEQELPTEEELSNANVNLEKHGYKVDYIVTHCCPNTVLSDYVMKKFNNISIAKQFDDRNVLTSFFDDINEHVQFEKWFFGHHHDDLEIWGKYHLLYHDIIRIV